MENDIKDKLNSDDNSGIESVRKEFEAPGFKEYDRYTVSEFLNDALNKKGYTIDNIYEAFQKNKSKEIRNTTKKEIENWFKGKSYPNLNQMYQMAYIIPIDPAYLWKIKTCNRVTREKC